MVAYTLDDPRLNAASAPYTYFLPPPGTLSSLGEGDLVKLVFRSVPPSDEWEAERMWVTVLAVHEDHLTGRLESELSDMPALQVGALVEFQRWHVVDCIFADEAAEEAQRSECRREYWDRCMVDECVLYEGVSVGYLYREEPDLGQQDDSYPDSGWRIRGDMRGLSEAEIDRHKAGYVPLGAVLNQDDSWLHLIDEPIGSAFLRDFETETYVRETS